MIEFSIRNAWFALDTTIIYKQRTAAIQQLWIFIFAAVKRKIFSIFKSVHMSSIEVKWW